MIFTFLSPALLFPEAPLQSEKLCSLTNFGSMKDVLGYYENIDTKKKTPITRAHVVQHLKTMGLDVSLPQPLSQLKLLEIKTTAFLAVLQYVLQLAHKTPLDQDLENRIKATKDRLIFGHFLSKQISPKINVPQIRKEALNEVKEKYKDEYGYDIFVVATDSMHKAKEVRQKIQKMHEERSSTLISDLESLAKETQKDIEQQKLKSTVISIAKQTNGWLVPRHVLQQQTQSNDLVFLVREILDKLFGPETTNQIIGVPEHPLKQSKLVSHIFEIDHHFLVIYVIKSKPVEQLPQLLELLGQAGLQQKLAQKQKEVEREVLKEITHKNRQAMTLVNDQGKEIPLPEHVIDTLIQQ
jgi:hypothetical protein